MSKKVGAGGRFDIFLDSALEQTRQKWPPAGEESRTFSGSRN